MSKVQKTVWFLHPRDSYTNEVLSEALQGLHSQEKFSNQECQDGEKRNLIEVPDYSFVARCWRSKTSLRISFKIFRAQGVGKPDLWLFPEPKKPTLEILKKKSLVVAGDKAAQKAATRF